MMYCGRPHPLSLLLTTILETLLTCSIVLGFQNFFRTWANLRVEANYWQALALKDLAPECSWVTCLSKSCGSQVGRTSNLFLLFDMLTQSFQVAFLVQHTDKQGFFFFFFFFSWCSSNWNGEEKDSPITIESCRICDDGHSVKQTETVQKETCWLSHCASCSMTHFRIGVVVCISISIPPNLYESRYWGLIHFTKL